MTLQKLACFVQVAECLNFSEAAQRQHITQPSLSRQISSLEEELNVQLFERNTRRVTLTPAGRELANEAREVIRRSNNLQFLARQISNGCIGRLKVGYASAIEGNFMADFLAENARCRPRIELNLQRMNQGRIITSLKGGEIDAAILFRNGLLDVSGLKLINIAQSRLCLILPPSHPWAERKGIPISELGELPLNFMDRSESAAAHDHFLTLCQRHGISPHVAQYCDEPQVLLLNVAAGRGGAILPVVNGDPIPFELVAIPLQGEEDVVLEDVVIAYNGMLGNSSLDHFLNWARRYVIRRTGQREPIA